MIGQWLYKTDSRGHLRKWMVEIDYTNEYLLISHGVDGGEIQEKVEYIEEGKGGRDVDEQLESRANSRINNKIDSGYVNSAELAKGPSTNVLGLKRPMLAQPSEKNIAKIDWRSTFAQRKYNGNRCLVHIDEDGIPIAYTRKGKEIKSIQHVLNELSHLPPGTTVDGELYCHGVALQTINSWIKRDQKESASLMYHVYDTIMDAPFSSRILWIEENIQDSNVIAIAETIRITNGMEAVASYMRQFRDEGYEGLILRHGDYRYEDGKRSQSLLKFKEWHDEEFAVLGIHESKDGWAILELKSETGIPFDVSAPGTMEDKFRVARNKQEYIGFSVNVQYAELTKDGVPFHPVATHWRERGE